MDVTDQAFPRNTGLDVKWSHKDNLSNYARHCNLHAGRGMLLGLQAVSHSFRRTSLLCWGLDRSASRLKSHSLDYFH